MTTDIRIRKRTCLIYAAVILLIICALLSNNGSSQCTNDVQEVRSDLPIEYSIVPSQRQAQNADSSR